MGWPSSARPLPHPALGDRPAPHKTERIHSNRGESCTVKRLPQETACHRSAGRSGPGPATPPAPRRGLALARLVPIAITLCAGAAPLQAQGILDPSFVPPSDMNWVNYASVATQVLQPDGKVVLGGIFDLEDTRVIRLNADGSEDASFIKVRADYGIERMLLQPDGKILLGNAVTLNDQPVRRLARLNPDGSLDASFSFPQVQVSGLVRGLALQPDGKLLITGVNFTDGQGAPIANCIARLNADGSIDPSFTSPFSLIDPQTCPQALALRADGKILAAGQFPLPDPWSTLVRLNPDGSLDADLTTNTGLSEAVTTLYPLPNGELLAAGFDTTQNRRLIRLNADDTRDADFDVIVKDASGDVGSIYNVFAQPNGKIVIAGRFETINGQRHRHIGRVDADGTVDASFDPAGLGIDAGQVTSLAIQADGRIIISGAFTAVDQVPRHLLARLLVPDPATEQFAFGAARQSVRWQRGGGGPELSQVRFESSANGQNWAPLGRAQWNEGAWELDNLNLPAGTFWLRARAFSITGGMSGGAGGVTGSYSGSVLESTRQLIARVTPGAGPGGAISPATPQYIDTGSTASFTITPDSGQQILAVEGSCGGHLNGTTFNTNAITADCTVQARFTDSTRFVITPSAGPGGSISPGIAQSVAGGTTVQFTVTPDPGHAITSIDGTCGGALAGTTFTTSPATANCTVEARFHITTVTVTASATGGHGSISPASQTRNHGEAATFEVTPDPGYNAVVSGCGGTLTGRTYTTAPLTANCAVTAGFSTYSEAGTSVTVKASLANENPCVSGTSAIEVPAGQDIALCATLTNGTGQFLRPMTVRRSALPGESNAVRPSLIQINGIASGASYDITDFGLITPRESGDLQVAWSASAGPVQGGSDNVLVPTYTYDDLAPFTALDLSVSPTARDLHLTRPGSSESVRMPFPFNFYGIPTDVLCISNDGALVPANDTCNLFPNGSWYMEIAVAMRPTEDYAQGYEGGTVYTDVVGTAPNRRFVVQWHSKRIVGSNGSAGVTFQALIDEATSAITYQYLSMASADPNAGNGSGARAGLALEYDRLRYLYPQGATLTNGKAIRWQPSPQPFTALASGSVHITVLKPEIDVEPTAVHASTAVDGTTTATLTLGNLGNVALQWDAAQASGDRPGEAQAAFASPTGSAAVPAIAHAWGGRDNSRSVSLDAAAPLSLDRTAGGSVNIWPVHAGSFVNNDFSRFYLITNYGRTFDATWQGALEWFDPSTSTGNRTILSGFGTVAMDGDRWRGMRWDPSTATLFGVASNWVDINSRPPFHTDVYSINPVTGWVTRIARLEDVGASGIALADIAIDNDGQMYGIDMGTDTLVAVDKVTGRARPVGPTGLNVGYWDVQSVDFDHSTGILYYATWVQNSPVGAQMFTLDTTTGAATLVGTIGDGSSGLRAMSIAKPGGPCVDAAGVPWLALDRAAGSIGALESDTVRVTLDASGLATGTYRANICVGNNTPFKSQVTIPVTFTVTAADHIFADGFETP